MLSASITPNIVIRGIQPKLEKKTSVLLDKIKSGNAELNKSSILIGSGLATKLSVMVGSKGTLLTPQLSANIMGGQPRFKRFKVTFLCENMSNSSYFSKLNPSPRHFL
jgi:lipoprotein-releasing system permease protein